MYTIMNSQEENKSEITLNISGKCQKEIDVIKEQSEQMMFLVNVLDAEQTEIVKCTDRVGIFRRMMLFQLMIFLVIFTLFVYLLVSKKN